MRELAENFWDGLYPLPDEDGILTRVAPLAGLNGVEADGVLKSWAVTKIPTLDPAVRRLAVRTEDHPLEYGGFEGVIPKGEYGAGPVMIWDEGTWEPIGDPHEGLAKGDLKFRLHGHRLNGDFVLVRMKLCKEDRGRQNWLLIKKRDDYAGDGDEPTETYDLWMKKLIAGYAFVNRVRVCPVAPEENPWRQRNTLLDGFGMVDQAWKWVYGTTNYQGSYALNGWFYSGLNDANKEFGRESSIQVPPKTPIFTDSIWVDAWPLATDTPARDLFQGGNSAGMQRLTIARHGSVTAKSAPRNVAAGTVLPGGITIEFADAHVENIRLENLWTLFWHKGYVPPASRPR